jgi:hypothetical protein
MLGLAPGIFFVAPRATAADSYGFRGQLRHKRGQGTGRGFKRLELNLFINHLQMVVRCTKCWLFGH